MCASIGIELRIHFLLSLSLWLSLRGGVIQVSNIFGGNLVATLSKGEGEA